MSYIRAKEIKGNKYYYEQRSVRIGDKVKTEHIRYVGAEAGNYHSSELGTTNNIYEQKAEKEFGTTENENEAGYIQSNGKMLDFSGRNDAVGYKNGKPLPNQPDYLKNQRNTDHRQISLILPRNKNNTDDYSYIKDYGEKTGSIRFSKSNTQNEINIELYKKPTRQQLTRIKSIATKNKSEIYADIHYKKIEMKEDTPRGVFGGQSKYYKNYSEFEKEIEEN